MKIEMDEHSSWTSIACLLILMGFTTIMVCSYYTYQSKVAAFKAGLMEVSDQSCTTHLAKP